MPRKKPVAPTIEEPSVGPESVGRTKSTLACLTVNQRFWLANRLRLILPGDKGEKDFKNSLIDHQVSLLLDGLYEWDRKNRVRPCVVEEFKQEELYTTLYSLGDRAKKAVEILNMCEPNPFKEAAAKELVKVGLSLLVDFEHKRRVKGYGGR